MWMVLECACELIELKELPVQAHLAPDGG